MAVQDIVCGDGAPRAIRLLICNGLIERVFILAGVQHQIPGAIEFDPLRVELHLDYVWVTARSDVDVIFEPTMIPIEDDVDARVDRLVLDPRVIRNRAMPLGGIVADQVVGYSLEFFRSANLFRGIRAFEFETYAV